MNVSSGPRADGGESLIELVIAIAILGIAVVAILGSMTTGVLVSAMQRSQGSAQVGIHSYAEAIEQYVASSPNHYVSCGAPSNYQAVTVGFTAPANMTVNTTTVQFWSTATSAWVSTCTSPDYGIQKLSLTSVGSEVRAVAETMTIVIRKPCGLGTTSA